MRTFRLAFCNVAEVTAGQGRKLDESMRTVRSELHQRSDSLESLPGGLVPSTSAAGPSYAACHSGSSSGPSLSESFYNVVMAYWEV